MSYLEKSAWIMLIALGVSAGGYVTSVASISAGIGHLPPPTVPLVIKFTVYLTLLAIAGHVAIALLSPRDADAPADERDRRVIDRAGHLSGYVMGAGLITALGHYLFNQNGHALFYLAFGSLILSQLAEYLVQIVLYRRGV